MLFVIYLTLYFTLLSRKLDFSKFRLELLELDLENDVGFLAEFKNGEVLNF